MSRAVVVIIFQVCASKRQGGEGGVGEGERERDVNCQLFVKMKLENFSGKDYAITYILGISYGKV